MTAQNLNKLAAIVKCDPRHCKYSECPVYLTNVNKCDALRVISLSSALLTDKFKGLPQTYDLYKET